VRDSVLLVHLVVLREGLVAFIQAQVLGDGDIVAGLLGVVVAVAEGLELLLVVRHEDRQSLDHELVGQQQSVVAHQRPLSHLQVPVVEGRGLAVVALLD
jgi:uncharacterized membrane-anchored protein